MKKICIKIEASREKGLGHLKRQTILANALAAKGFEPCFLVARRDHLFEHLAYETMVVHDKSDFELLSRQISILIIDEPEFPQSWLEYLARIPLVVGIDELGPLREHLDLHICTTLLGLDFCQQRRGKTDEYIGLKYFIFEHQNQLKVSKQNSKVLVSFGGSDPNHISEAFFSGIHNYEWFKHFHWLGVIGPGFPGYYRNQLQEQFKFVDWLIEPDNLYPFLQICPLSFTAGGITAYEVLHYRGLPLCIAQNDEQQGTIERLTAKNLAIDCGRYERINWTVINQLLTDRLFINKAEQAMVAYDALTEGDSTARVVELICKYAKSRCLS